MGLVAELIAEGSRKRYRVYGYLIDDGWWAYSFQEARRPPRVLTKVRMSNQVIAELSRTLPRCAQRAAARHGGGSKMAITDERTAQDMAEFLGARSYPCPLPAPAIGKHWHVSTTKKRQGREEKFPKSL